MVEWTPAQLVGNTNTPHQGGQPLVDPRKPREHDQIDLQGSRALEGVYFEPSVHSGGTVDRDRVGLVEGPWTLPGRGEAGARCGIVAPNGFCDGPGHVTFGRHDCGRRSCPRCWYSSWRNPRVVEIVVRLSTARYAADEGLDKRAVHAVVSPDDPGEITTTGEFYQSRTEAVDAAKAAGIRGGVIVPHGFAIIDEIQDEIEAEREAGEFEGGDWKWVREHDAPWFNFVEWRPHFHVIGLARDVDSTAVEADFNVHNIKRKRADGEVKHSLAPFHLTRDAGYRDQASVAGYTLSHATFESQSNRQTITWFGTLHGSNFDPEEVVSEGVYTTIRRTARAIVGAQGTDDEDQDGDEDRECPFPGCSAGWHPIHEAPDFLDQRGDRLSSEAYDRIHTAWLWSQGDLKPPPGLKNPTTEEQAKESFAALLGGDVDVSEEPARPAPEPVDVDEDDVPPEIGPGESALRASGVPYPFEDD